VRDGTDVKVVGNADDCVHITQPAAPGGNVDLSDDDLSNATRGMPTGGTNWSALTPPAD
jgi:hypothetical protein